MNKPSFNYSKGTFGGSKAADVIDTILLEEQNQRYTKRVAYFITHMQENIKHLSDIQDSDFRKSIIFKIRNELLLKLGMDELLPPIVKSHLSTHLTTMCRKVFEDKTKVPG